METALTYDANAQIILAETCIEFPEEGISTSAQVVLSLSHLPDIHLEFPEITTALNRTLFNWMLKNEPSSIKLLTGEQIEVMAFGNRVVPIDGLVTGLDTTELLHNVRFGLVNFPDYMNSGFLVPYEDEGSRKGLRVGRTIQLAGCGKTLLSTQGRKLSDDKRRPIACSERIIRIGLSHAECRRDS